MQSLSVVLAGHSFTQFQSIFSLETLDLVLQISCVLISSQGHSVRVFVMELEGIRDE